MGGVQFLLVFKQRQRNPLDEQFGVIPVFLGHSGPNGLYKNIRHLPI